MPSFSQFLTRLLPLSSLALPPPLPSLPAASLQPLSSQTRTEKTPPRLLLVSRRCHHRMTWYSVPFLPLWPAHVTAHSRKSLTGAKVQPADYPPRNQQFWNPVFILVLILWLPESNTQSCSCSPVSLCSPVLPIWLLFLFSFAGFPQLLLLSPWTEDAAVDGRSRELPFD